MNGWIKMSHTYLYSVYYAIRTQTNGRLPFEMNTDMGHDTRHQETRQNMIFIPILIDTGHILNQTAENRHKCTEKSAMNRRLTWGETEIGTKKKKHSCISNSAVAGCKTTPEAGC
jgi:hypothetical protein